MLAVGDVTKFLGTYVDFLVLMGLFPLLAHVQFGSLLLKARANLDEAATPANTSSDEASAGQASTQKSGHAAAPANVPKPSSLIPSAVALLLLLLAEVCAHVDFFDPQEPQMRRAAGELVRAQRRSIKGENSMTAVMETIVQLGENNDVMDLLRFVLVFGSLGGLFTHTTILKAKLDEPSGGSSTSIFKLAGAALKSVASIVFCIRFWCFLALSLAFVVGNSALLLKAVRKPGVLGLVRAAAGPLRAAASTIAALTATYDGPMPIWAAANVAAAAARAAKVVVRERLTIGAIFAGGLLAGGDLAVHRASLAMDAWCILVSLPGTLSPRPGVRNVLRLLILLAPAVAVVSDMASMYAIQEQVTTVIEKANLCFGVCGVMMIFLGGYCPMMVMLVLGQALTYIHRLDKAKF